MLCTPMQAAPQTAHSLLDNHLFNSQNPENGSPNSAGALFGTRLFSSPDHQLTSPEGPKTARSFPAPSGCGSPASPPLIALAASS
jgi:hypothetical protein